MKRRAAWWVRAVLILVCAPGLTGCSVAQTSCSDAWQDKLRTVQKDLPDTLPGVTSELATYDCDSGGPARLMVTSPRTWEQDAALLARRGCRSTPENGVAQMTCPTLGPGIIVINSTGEPDNHREVILAENAR